MNKRNVLLEIIIGLIILFGIFYFVKPQELIPTFKKLNLFYLTLSVLTYLFIHLLFAYRLKLIFDQLNKKINIKEIFFAHFGGMLASDFTPARTGYFLTPLLIGKKVGIESSLSAIMIAQFTIFISKIVFAPLALFYLAAIVKMPAVLFYLIIIGIAVLAVFAFLFFIALWTKKSTPLINFFFKFKLIKKILKDFKSKIKTFQKESKNVKPIITHIFSVTIFILVMGGLNWMFLGYSLGYKISFLTYFFTSILIIMLHFIPLTPAGLGVQEGAGVAVLTLVGFTPGDALGFMLIYRIYSILIHTIGIKVITEKGIDFVKAVHTTK